MKGGLKSQVQPKVGFGIVLEAVFKEDLRGRPEVQSCTQPCVQAPRDLVKLALTVDTQVCAFWQVLPDRSVDVLVSPRCHGAAQSGKISFQPCALEASFLCSAICPWAQVSVLGKASLSGLNAPAGLRQTNRSGACALQPHRHDGTSLFGAQVPLYVLVMLSLSSGLEAALRAILSECLSRSSMRRSVPITLGVLVEIDVTARVAA